MEFVRKSTSPAPSETTAPRISSVRPANQRLLQPKLEVGRSDDPFEREADAVADQVVNVIQRLATDDTGIRIATASSRIQRATNAADSSAGPLDSSTERSIQASRGGGTAFDGPIRRSMESAFDADFSGVRLHTGGESKTLNNRIQAKAFTVGQDIYFRDGAPSTTKDDQHLLAHELTHTIQQTGRAARVGRRADLAMPTTTSEPRVQRMPVRVLGKTAEPVVQRVGEARAAYAELDKLVGTAKQHRTAAEKPGVDLVALEDLKKKIVAIGEEADRQITRSATDKNKADVSNFGGGKLNNFRAQITAAHDSIHSAAVAGNSSATSIENTVIAIRNGITGHANAAQNEVQGAVGALATTSARTTEGAARVRAAKAARTHATAVDGMIDSFDATSAEAISDVTEWTKATVGVHLVESLAQRLRPQLDDAIARTKRILALLATDAHALATMAERLIAAQKTALAAGKTEKAKQEEAATATGLAEAAQLELERAQAHALHCQTEAEHATKLADEAVDIADEADSVAKQATDSSTSATGAAGSLTRGIAFYEKHRAYAPSTFADETIDKRKQEASDAEQLAEKKRSERDTAVGVAEEKRAASKPLVKDASDAAEANSTAKSTLAGANKDRDSKAGLKDQADQASATATLDKQAAMSSGQVIKGESTALLGTHTLFAAMPDATQRAEVRILFGDAVVGKLLDGGVKGALLVAGATSIKAMLDNGWSVENTAALISSLQTLLVTAPLLADFAKLPATITAARAAELLACVGDKLPWFSANALASADRLMTHGWPATDIKAMLTSAEKSAKLVEPYVNKFTAVIIDVNLSLVNADKFLKASLPAAFLIDNALSSVKKLLLVPWDADKVVDLVTAAHAIPKPTKAQFEKFCTLVADNAVSADHAIKIMQSADCTGEFLVDIAFVAMSTALTDAWTVEQLKPLVKAAATVALTKVQIDRFYTLVKDNAFTAANALKCLTAPNVVGWTNVMNQIDLFIADGNTGTPVATGAGHHGTTSHGQGPQRINIDVTNERVVHFAQGHTYAHYQFTSANIFRGGGNQPSSMWPGGTDAAALAASALAAIQSGGVRDQANVAKAGNGNGVGDGYFHQVGHAGFNAGVKFNTNSNRASMTQYFPDGNSVSQHIMNAIGLLFNGAVA